MPNQQISVNPSLDFFQVTPMQTSHESSFIQVFNSQNAILPDTPIEFNVRGSENYIDLRHINLYLRVKIVLDDGTNLLQANDNEAAFANLPFASIFKHVKLSLNGVEITPHGQTYSYRSMFETLFNATGSSANSLLNLGWAKDTGDAEDIAATNTGFRARATRTNRSRTLELMGTPFLDFLKQDKELISHVSMQFSFYPNSNEFCVNQANNQTHKYVIEHAELHVRKNKISPTYILAQESALKISNINYQYPINTFKIFRISAGCLSYNSDDIFLSAIPSKMYISLVRNLGFAGTKGNNPYYFIHSGVRAITVCRDGTPLPHSKVTDIDFDHNRTLQLYNSLLDVSDRSELLDEGLIFSQQEMQAGYFFAGYNLLPDRGNLTHVSPKRNGNISISLSFNNATANDMELLIMAEFDCTTQITLARNILHTFPL